jgi:hypothetical protein
MSLSTLELIKLIETTLTPFVQQGNPRGRPTEGPPKRDPPSYEIFVLEMMESKLQVPGIFGGWNGIDSVFCVVAIDLSIDHFKGRPVNLRSFTKASSSAVLSSIYSRYVAVCGASGLSFAPCIKGLATILKRKQLSGVANVSGNTATRGK